MKLLDFSTGNLEELDTQSDWELGISNFLKDWQSSSEFIASQTSGSTGEPKTIQLPKSAMKMSAELTGEFFDLKKGDSALLCLPVGFIAGKMMLVRAIELGLKLYCIEPKSKIDLNEFPEMDFVPMTPMQVENSLDSISKIKCLLIGGAPLSNSLREKLLEFSTQCYESYGMTETITHIALKKINQDDFHVLKGVGISQDARDCLVIQTPYFEEKIITNDVVEIRSNTTFKWLGRADNVINSGGIKLFPEKIEDKLKPYLSQDFIISSIPNKILGEELILIIEGNQPIEIDFNSLNLSRFEIPKKQFHLAEFPRTEAGKLKRTAIREAILNQI